tara:strand:+ start:866 stop:1498 length:633 start_codon:yes stop_codon:yes gene_type:complete
MSYINGNILTYSIRFYGVVGNTLVKIGTQGNSKYAGWNWGSSVGFSLNSGNPPTAGATFGSTIKIYQPALHGADFICPFDCRLKDLAFVAYLYDPWDDDFVFNVGAFRMNVNSSEGFFPGAGAVGPNGALGSWDTAQWYCMGIATSANIDDTSTAGRMVKGSATFTGTNGDISAGDPIVMGGWGSPGDTTNADQDPGNSYGVATISMEIK